MAARTWTLALLLALTGALAGCTDNDAPRNGDDATPPPADGNPGSGGQAPPRSSAPPADFLLAESGEIQGPFSETWDIQVANVAFRQAHLHFALAGVQPGAPPTARIHLTLYDPNGAPVQSGVVGLGAPSGELTWDLTPAQLAQAGTYQLKATSASDTPLPSGGFAHYTLDAAVLY